MATAMWMGLARVQDMSDKCVLDANRETVSLGRLGFVLPSIGVLGKRV